MSDFSDSDDSLVRPLTVSTKDGEPYTRPASVETQIEQMLCLHQSEWIASLDDLKNETIVYLIREVRQGDKELYGRLLYELARPRVPRLASRWVRDFDPTTTEEILYKVTEVTLALVLASRPTRQSEYLEVAFGQFVKHLTLNMVEKYNRNPMVKRGEILPDPADDDSPAKVKRPIELAADDGPTQEAAFLKVEGTAQLQKAYGAVKDPKDLEVFKLRYGEGIPIESSDPDVEDLVRRTGESRRKIKYRLERTMRVIRKVLGVS